MHAEHPLDDYRFVLDEGAMQWNTLDDAEVITRGEQLADLMRVQLSGHRVAIMEGFYETEFLPGQTWFAMLFSSDSDTLPIDLRRQITRLLDRAIKITPTEADIPCTVHLKEIRISQEPSWGAMHGIQRSLSGHTTAILVPPSAASGVPHGRHSVDCGDASGEVLVINQSREAPLLWRMALEREARTTSILIEFASFAFPRLIFSPDLDLRRFSGKADETVPWLMRLLSALNDRFEQALSDERGDQAKVQALFSAMGVDISPESSQTRANRAAYQKRKVTLEGNEYVCEWHGKRMWNVDRVHFSLPIPKYDGRILIGIFCDHLPT